jgi:hypothetical protein
MRDPLRAGRWPASRLLGDLPQRVGGDRLHLLGELLPIARHERDLLLGHRAQLGELPLVRGLALAGSPQLEARRTLSLHGSTCRIDRASQARDEHDRGRRGTGEHPENEHGKRHHRSPHSTIWDTPGRLLLHPDNVHADLQATSAENRSRRTRAERQCDICGLPCSHLSLRGQATTYRP